jgi:hypothetical protein
MSGRTNIGHGEGDRNHPRFARLSFWLYKNQVAIGAIVFLAIVFWLAFIDTRGGW